MKKNLQYIQDIINGKIPPPPIARLLGFQVTNYCDGCTTIEMEITKEYWNPMNTLHGGIYCDLADAAMSFSLFTTLEPNEIFTTIDLRVNYFKPITQGRLIASSTIIKRGKKLGYMECEVKDREGNLVAKASSTCLIMKNGIIKEGD